MLRPWASLEILPKLCTLQNRSVSAGNIATTHPILHNGHVQTHQESMVPIFVCSALFCLATCSLKQIKKYLGCMPPGKAQNVWCEDRVLHSLHSIATMLQDPHSVCGCTQIPTHTGPCVHTSIHTPAERTDIFGKEWTPHAHGTALIFHPHHAHMHHALHTNITAKLQVVRDAPPKKKPFCFKSFSCVVHKVVEEGIPRTNDTHAPHPANVTTPLSRKFKQTWPHWKPVRLDKNTSC